MLNVESQTDSISSLRGFEKAEAIQNLDLQVWANRNCDARHETLRKSRNDKVESRILKGGKNVYV